MKKKVKVPAREFNHAHNYYIAKLTRGDCKEIVVTRRGVPFLKVMACKETKLKK